MASRKTKDALMNLYESAIGDIDIMKNYFSKYLTKILENIPWRTSNYKHWNLVLKNAERRNTKYSGLVNLVCICYMNSVFQQLFMVNEFRDFIIKAEIKEEKEAPASQNVLFQFQLIMQSLRDVPRAYFSPGNFCKVFKNFDGSEINVMQQMDADEFLINLMDKLETELKKTKQDKIISRIFGG